MASKPASSDDVDAAVDETASAGAALSFTDFLERMKDPAAADLVRSIRAFVRSFENQPRDAERDAPRVQAFFDRADEAFRAHPAWRGASPAVLAAAGEGLEKYVLTKIHAQVFGASALDVERDEALSQRLRALEFVRPEHLEIPASHAGLEENGSGAGSGNGGGGSSSSSAAARALALAQRELSRVNAFKAPRDKLVCVLNACRVISDSLGAVASREAAERERRRREKGGGGESGAGGGEASAATQAQDNRPAPSTTSTSASRGADDFLPLLIYVLIRAAPPKLASNLEYVQRFRGARRFHGEAAYFFTQLYAAASFVETVNTQSFHGVDPDEFVARMASAGVPDMQLLPPPAAVVEAALADIGGQGGGGGERGGETAVGAAAAASASASSASASASGVPQHPQAEEASAVRENPAFFLAASERTTTTIIPRDLPRHHEEPHLLPPPSSSSSFFFYPTAEQLEKEGERLVVAADEAGEELFLAGSRGDRFLDPALGAEDLSIADVSELLRSYRATALRCEALCRAADARARAWRREEAAEEGTEGEERGRGAAVAAAPAGAAAAAAAAGERDTFVPSPPWVPSTSSAAAAAAEEDKEGGVVAAPPEAELDLSALSLSQSPPPPPLAAAAPLPPLPLQQQPPPPQQQLDVAHLLSSSPSSATTPRVAEAVDAAANANGGVSNSASLI